MALLIIYLIVGIISLAFFLKLWAMCSDVETIKKHISHSHSLSSLVFLKKTNPIEFEKRLERRIFDDLMEIVLEGDKVGRDSRRYEMVYTTWNKRCKYYGWGFPALLRDLDKLDKFCEAFDLPKR